jgi:hypothetical protein
MKRPIPPIAAPVQERIAAMPAANAQTYQQLLRRCRVKVGGTTYTGLWPTTSDAVLDAMERHPGERCISARVAA